MVGRKKPSLYKNIEGFASTIQTGNNHFCYIAIGMGGYDYNPAITERRSVEVKARLQKSGYQIMLRSAKLLLGFVIVRRGYLMAHWFTSLFVFMVLVAHPALAQQIYKWKDEKGRSHFSQTPPSGVGAEKIIEGSSTPKASPANPPNQISNPSPPSGGGG